LTTQKATEFRFIDGGRVEYDVSVACGIFSANTIIGDKFKWNPYKTVYAHVQGFWELEVKNFPMFQKMALKLGDAEAKVIELKVVDEGVALEDDSEWREGIVNAFTMKFLTDLPKKEDLPIPIPLPFDLTEMPIIPYPSIAICLGLKAESPEI